MATTTLAEARSELAVWRKRWSVAVKYGRQHETAGREIAARVKLWRDKVADVLRELEDGEEE